MRSVVLLYLLLSPSWLWATVQVGTGLSSVMSGRMIPGLELTLSSGSWRASGNAIGVNNAYYFHSSYTLSLFRTWKSGPLFWGEVESGFGGGIMYAQRGFQDQGSTQEVKKSDVTLGPAFFVQWNVAGPGYLKLEMVWGLRDPTSLIGLNGQDVIFLSAGLSAW